MKKARYIIFASTVALAAIATVAYSAGSGTKNGDAEMGRIGDPAPALEVAAWVKGAPVSLAEGQGTKAYLIEFWATWCPECDKAAPRLSEIQEKYGDSGLSVVGISMEEKEVVEGYVKSKSADIGYSIAVDKEQKSAMAYMAKFGLEGIPASFLVDRQGKIAWVGHPADPELEAQLAKLFPPAEKSASKSSAAAPAKSKKAVKPSGGSGTK